MILIGLGLIRKTRVSFKPYQIVGPFTFTPSEFPAQLWKIDNQRLLNKLWLKNWKYSNKRWNIPDNGVEGYIEEIKYVMQDEMFNTHNVETTTENEHDFFEEGNESILEKTTASYLINDEIFNTNDTETTTESEHDFFEEGNKTTLETTTGSYHTDIDINEKVFTENETTKFVRMDQNLVIEKTNMTLHVEGADVVLMKIGAQYDSRKQWIVGKPDENGWRIITNRENGWYLTAKSSKELTVELKGFKLNPLSIVTICGNNPWWQPLFVTCILLVIFLIASSFLLSVLDKMLDQSALLQISRRCFPANCFDPIWNEDQMDILEPIKSYFDNPTQIELLEVNKEIRKNTGQDLMETAIENDYYMVVDELLNNEPISDDLIELAIKKGSPNMIKTLLDLQIQKEDEKRKIDMRNLPVKRNVNFKQLKATTVDVEKIKAELKTAENLRKNYDESSQVEQQKLQAAIVELDKEISDLTNKNYQIGINLTVKKHNNKGTYIMA